MPEPDGSLAHAERLLRHGDAEEALLLLIEAHETSVAARDGKAAVGAGLRLNMALAVLHEAWQRFPTGEQLAERFEVPAGLSPA